MSVNSSLSIVIALQAFHKITRYGEKQDHKYYLDGYAACSDIDGYTVQISDNKVSLWIYFHNKHRTEHPSRTALDHFWQGLQRIADKEY